MSASSSDTLARFHLRVEAYPGVLPRLLEPLAKRDLVPESVQVQRDGAEMTVAITVLPPPGIAALIAGNMGQVVGVLECRWQAEAAADTALELAA